MKTKIYKQKLIFSFGILNLLMSIMYIGRDIKIFLLFFIIAFTCFLFSRQILFKIIAKPIIKRIVKLNHAKSKLLKETSRLEINKQEILKYISNNEENINEINRYKETVNQLLLKEKELNREIIKLEDKKRTIEQITKQEEIITRAIEGEEKTFNILSKENETLEEKKKELEMEISRLTKTVIPLKKKTDFIQKYNIDYIDNLNGYEFEKFIAKLLESLGYRDVTTTKEGADYGIDVIAVKDDIRYAIQCKNYSQSVGNDAVQEAYSGKNFYNCHVSIVVTNNYFTANAINQAKMNKVVLWDRNKLNELIKELTEM